MSNPFVGEIRLFAGTFAPAGWALCDGSVQSIAENTTLFQLIGTTYGGDGQNTFALPDFRGRIPVHQGSGYVIGQSGGSETVTLAVSQLPAHTHALRASSAPATLSSPGGNVLAATSSNSYSAPPPPAGDVLMANVAIAAGGGSQPHDNMAPFLAMNYIISLFGIYPSQN